MKLNRKVDCLNCQVKDISIFCDLNEEALSVLNEEKSCIMFKKGQIIFSEGVTPQGLYCVHHGKVKLSQAGDMGREQIVRFAKAGDVIGYRALLSGERFLATAIALDDCQICIIPKDIFLKLIEKEVSLSMQVMKLLSQNLGKAEHRITNLAQKPVRKRVAEALLFLKETYGTEADGEILNVVLSREEIANIVGTATETAIRILSEFKADGIIDLQVKKIKILDHKKLLRIANLQD